MTDKKKKEPLEDSPFYVGKRRGEEMKKKKCKCEREPFIILAMEFLCMVRFNFCPLCGKKLRGKQ